MINASSVNAITSGESEKVKWWEKNGVVTVKIKEGATFALNEVLAEGLPPSITGERYRILTQQTNSSTTRPVWIEPDGKLTSAVNITTALSAPCMAMYQC